MTTTRNARTYITSLDPYDGDTPMTVLQTYNHKMTLTTDFDWATLFVAQHTVLTNDNWVMRGVYWDRTIDDKGNKLVKLDIEYFQLSSNTFKNSAGEEVSIYSKCPTATKLELLKLGYFPLDKLKSLSRGSKE